DLERGVDEQDLFAVLLADTGEGDHAKRSAYRTIEVNASRCPGSGVDCVRSPATPRTHLAAGRTGRAHRRHRQKRRGKVDAAANHVGGGAARRWNGVASTGNPGGAARPGRAVDDQQTGGGGG